MSPDQTRYVELIAVLKTLKTTDDPRYDEVIDQLDTLWWRMDTPSREEVEGTLIAIDHVDRTAQGYPPAEPDSD